MAVPAKATKPVVESPQPAGDDVLQGLSEKKRKMKRGQKDQDIVSESVDGGLDQTTTPVASTTPNVTTTDSTLEKQKKKHKKVKVEHPV